MIPKYRIDTELNLISPGYRDSMAERLAKEYFERGVEWLEEFLEDIPIKFGIWLSENYYSEDPDLWISTHEYRILTTEEVYKEFLSTLTL